MVGVMVKKMALWFEIIGNKSKVNKMNKMYHAYIIHK